MKSVSILMPIMLVALLISPVGADVYSWVDADGVRHFSNTPPPDPTAGVTAIQEQVHDPVADQQRTAIDRRTMDRIGAEQKKLKATGARLPLDRVGQTKAQKTKPDPTVSKKKTFAQRQRARAAAQSHQGK